MRQLCLGTQPPRLGGVQVYDRNIAEDEIVIDIDLIYNSNGCLSFSLQKIPCEINKVGSS